MFFVRAVLILRNIATFPFFLVSDTHFRHPGQLRATSTASKYRVAVSFS
jgi:hypothetical protein